MERILKYKKIIYIRKKYNYELFNLFNLSFDKISVFEIAKYSSIVEPATDFKLENNQIIIKVKKSSL